MMMLLLILPLWAFGLVLVVALCRGASAGDRGCAHVTMGAEPERLRTPAPARAEAHRVTLRDVAREEGKRRGLARQQGPDGSSPEHRLVA